MPNLQRRAHFVPPQLNDFAISLSGNIFWKSSALPALELYEECDFTTCRHQITSELRVSDVVTYESIVVGFLALGLVIGLEVEVLGSGVHVLVLLAPLVLQAWELGVAQRNGGLISSLHPLALCVFSLHVRSQGCLSRIADIKCLITYKAMSFVTRPLNTLQPPLECWLIQPNIIKWTVSRHFPKFQSSEMKNIKLSLGSMYGNTPHYMVWYGIVTLVLTIQCQCKSHT